MKPNIRKAILGGLIGTLLMTLMMYFVAPKMTGQRMDIAASLGSMMGGIWLLGMMAHFMNGVVIFPLIYALVLYRLLPEPAWFKGLLWGGILWVMAQVIVMPMMGGGLLSSNMGGMPAAIGSLIGHLAYGAALGVIAGGPLNEQSTVTA